MSEIAEAPLTEADITRVVHAFYARVRRDDMLAPIFAQKIPEDHWPVHMSHIADFWSSIFLKTHRFTGNPMIKHLSLHGITPAHFAHWLALFQETGEQVLLPHQSAAMSAMAERIGKSLQMGLAFHRNKTDPDNNPFAEYGIRRSHQL